MGVGLLIALNFLLSVKIRFDCVLLVVYAAFAMFNGAGKVKMFP